MRKQWTEAKFKSRNTRHAARSQQRRKRVRPTNAIGTADFFRSGRLQSLHAPETFSLVDSPQECTAVISRMLTCGSQKLYFNMAEVARITPDAIALTTATVRYLASHGVRVRGNYPINSAAQEAVHQSGFDELFGLTGFSPDAHGHLLCDDTLKVDSKNADPMKAQRLIDLAANGGRDLGRLKPSYGHLIDCMTNTYDHANPKTAGSERWWASVFVDKERGYDCFTFIDLGIGIFGSAKLNFYRRLQASFSMTRPEIIRSLFSGGIPSSTNLGYRGRGLPCMYDSLKAGTISRLVIATDDVYGDLGRNHFETLTFRIKGLLLYWEVSHVAGD